MDNSILIGKYIYKFLSEDDNIHKKTNNAIWPLIADSDTKYPFIVYSNTDLTPSYDKDGVVDDSLSVQIICISNNYTEVVELANDVRNLLEFKHYKDNKINITKILVSNVGSQTVDDAYLEVLTFSITVE